MNATPSVLTARPATVEDLDEVAGLLHRVFGARRSAADLRWKFAGSAGRLLGPPC